MHNLTYGDINSEDYKVYITNAGIYKSPEKRYRKYIVPGRNGDLLEDTGTFENVEVEYPFCVYEDCDTNYRAYVAALKRKKGYQRIEDTYHPEYYRMGAFLDESEPKKVTPDGEMCNGVLKFDCMPQKWLKNGENPVVLWTPTIIRGDDPEAMYEGIDEMQSGTFRLGTDMIGRTIKVTVHCKDSDYVNFQIKSLDENKNLINGDGYAGYINNRQVTLTYDQNAVYGTFGIYTNNDIDSMYVTVENFLTVNGVEQTLTLGKAITLSNPTGFVTAPLIEFFGLPVMDLELKNYIGDTLDETYVLYSDIDANVYHAFLDCDAMYMYDDEGRNISNLLHITTARNSKNQSLVFPRFGSDKINLMPTSRPYNAEQANSDWLPIIYIYPRWWTV